MEEKELKIMFYGNTFIPLSVDCDFCHNFNYICGGSVAEGCCQQGTVEDIGPSLVADEILKKHDSNFILARVCGFDLEEYRINYITEMTKKIESSNDENYKAALLRCIKQYDEACDISEEEIEKIRAEFDVYNTMYGLSKVDAELGIKPDTTDAHTHDCNCGGKCGDNCKCKSQNQDFEDDSEVPF